MLRTRRLRAACRNRVGLPAGTGPYKVITDIAVLGFDDESKRMRLESVPSGTTVQEVKEHTGFELIIPHEVGETAPATEEELHILRTEIDPGGNIVGRQV